MKRNSIPKAEQTKVRVLVADDHPVVRHGSIANVKPQPDMIVVAEAGDGAGLEYAYTMVHHAPQSAQKPQVVPKKAH